MRRTLLALPVLALAAALSACASSGGDAPAVDNPLTASPTSTTASPATTSPATTSPAGVTSPTGTGTATGAQPAACAYPADGAPQPVGTPSTTTLLAPATLSFHLAIGAAAKASDLTITTAASAPCTVNAIAFLGAKGYFNGVSCHRLTTSGIYVLQCGDPTGTGSGTPGFSFADELSGSETYPAGTIAMANTSQPNTNGSQFFIVYADSTLPPSYTVWGHIDAAGIAAVKAIAAAGTANGSSDGPPAQNVKITSVTAG